MVPRAALADLLVQRCIRRHEVLLRFLLKFGGQRYTLAGGQAGTNRDAVASGDHFAALGVKHLVQEAEVLFANSHESALDFDELPTAQFLQKLIVLAND